ncbi:MAG TPA: hypothetical protein VHV26_02015 [Rhizomicrobium sp.]|jgi:hypothetical protein|nr:hypothetical protein [Rhizomicrobium sp.]
MVRDLIHGVNDMAKSKKKKAKKATKASKARKAPARKATAKRKVAGRKTGRKTAKAAPRKAAARKAAKKAAPKRTAAKKPASKSRQKTIGEGDYEASRAFLKDQGDFVSRNRSKIPAMGEEAEKALDGPEGADLKAAEAEAAGHSKAAE